MIRIIIESGKKTTNEYNFIRKLINLYHSDWVEEEDFEIISIGGYTKLKNPEGVHTLNRAVEGKDKNLLIFDADTEDNNGGHATRKDELLRWQEEHSIDFELFLFPNNRDDGMFETLLERILKTEHHCLLRCFEGYCECVQSNNCNTPSEKARIYSCVDALMNKSDKKKNKLRDGLWFDDGLEFWDFDSVELEPLKAFLLEYR